VKLAQIFDRLREPPAGETLVYNATDNRVTHVTITDDLTIQ
jgi:hypothetical protein